MPLTEITATDILARRDEAGRRAWPSRLDEPNRVEPVAMPAFDVPFRLVPGEAVFTIGSCFARHVERKLLDRGFRIPALDIFRRPDFAQFDTGILNNYGVPSIHQELAWALNPDMPFPEGSFTEVSTGRFVDDQLPVGIRPAPLDVVRERRRAIAEAMRSARECRVVIITLGLTEVWFDRRFGIYVNMHPRLGALRNDPNRFVLQILDHAETLEHLRKVILLLRRFGRPDVQVVLTVSPVPMGMTHRDMDVMVANTYSKAVLRVATEQVVAENADVHYYPSYESVVLSDRRRAWEADMVHVTQDMVDLNVGRMVRDYVGGGAVATDAMDVPTLLAHIEDMSKGDGRQRWKLLEENEARVAGSIDFALVFVRSALNRSEFEAARRALEGAPPTWKRSQRELLEAEILIGEERFVEARDLLASIHYRVQVSSKPGSSERRYWLLAVQAHIGARDMDAAREAALTWAKVHNRPGRQRVYEMLGRGYRDNGMPAEAAHYLNLALETNDNELVVLDLAEVLMTLGRLAEARGLLDRLRPESQAAHRRLDLLRTFMDPQREAIAG